MHDLANQDNAELEVPDPDAVWGVDDLSSLMATPQPPPYSASRRYISFWISTLAGIACSGSFFLFFARPWSSFAPSVSVILYEKDKQSGSTMQGAAYDTVLETALYAILAVVIGFIAYRLVRNLMLPDRRATGLDADV